MDPIEPDLSLAPPAAPTAPDQSPVRLQPGKLAEISTRQTIGTDENDRALRILELMQLAAPHGEV
jgi:hypothetical protein